MANVIGAVGSTTGEVTASASTSVTVEKSVTFSVERTESGYTVSSPNLGTQEYDPNGVSGYNFVSSSTSGGFSIDSSGQFNVSSFQGDSLPVGQSQQVTMTYEVTYEPGATRALSSGEPVFAEDSIQTGDGSSLVINSTDGSQVAIGANENAILEESMAANNEVTATGEGGLSPEEIQAFLDSLGNTSEEGTATDPESGLSGGEGELLGADAQAIQEALLSGESLDDLEATAAGLVNFDTWVNEFGQANFSSRTDDLGFDERDSFASTNTSFLEPSSTPIPSGIVFPEPVIFPSEFFEGLATGGGVAPTTTLTEDTTPTSLNVSPIVASGTLDVEEDGTLSGQVTGFDVESSNLTYALVSGVATGILVFNADGSFTYTPGESFNSLAKGETDSVAFSYQASDGVNLSDPATVTLSITGANDAPVVEVVDLGFVLETGTISFTSEDLLSNATDADNPQDMDIVENSVVVNGTQGTLESFEDPESGITHYTFTPSETVAKGDLAISFQVTDGIDTTDATATITVQGAPVATISIDSISDDGIINAAESQSDLDITGTVGGDASEGDTVTLTVGENTYSGTVNSENGFSIPVPGDILAAAGSLSASVSGTDNNGNAYSSSDTADFAVDLESSATITIDSITDDDIINASESESDIDVTGTVGGDASEGDTVTLTVGQNSYSGTVSDDGTYSISVPGAVLAAAGSLSASVSGSDSSGNPFSASSTADFDVDTDIGTVSISFEEAGDDGAYNTEEIGEDGTITATISLEGSSVGDTLTFSLDEADAQSVTLTQEHLDNGYSLEVTPGTSVTASLSDAAGNSSLPASETAAGYSGDVLTPVVDLDGETGSQDTNMTIDKPTLADFATDASGESFSYSFDDTIDNRDRGTKPEGNGIELDFGDQTSSLSFSFGAEHAGYNNVFGMYTLGEDGQPESFKIVINNTNDRGETGSDLGSIDASGKVGFFLIANGASQIPDDATNLNFEMVDGKPVLSVGDDPISANVYYSDMEFNSDGKEHFHAALSDDGKSLVLGIEDLHGLGDADYDDLVMEIGYSADIEVVPELTISDFDGNIQTATIDLSDSASGDDYYLNENTLQANGLEASFDPETGELTITAGEGGATPEAFESVLQTLTLNVNEGNVDSSESFTISVTDITGLTSEIATVGVNAADVPDPIDPNEEPHLEITDLPEYGTLSLNGEALQVGDTIEDPSAVVYTVNEDATRTFTIGNDEWAGAEGQSSYTITREDGLGITISAQKQGESSMEDALLMVAADNDGNINNHEGVGLGVKGEGDKDQIDLGEMIVVDFDQPVDSANIGLAGLGGHFVASTNGPDATAEWVAYLDGEEVASGSARQDSDDNKYTNTIEVDVPFDSITFSVDANRNSNFTIEYIEPTYTPNDSWSYGEFTGDDLTENGITTIEIDNNAPTAQDATLEVDPDAAVTFSMADFTSDLEDDFSGADSLETQVRIDSLPENGTLYYNGQEVTQAQIEQEGGFIIDDASQLKYEVDEGFTGTEETLQLGSTNRTDNDPSGWDSIEGVTINAYKETGEPVSQTSSDIEQLGSEKGSNQSGDGSGHAHTETRTFDFGPQNAGQVMTLTFAAQAEGSWDNVNDSFTLIANGEASDPIVYDKGDYRTESFDVVLDENGQAEVIFNVDTTGTDEYINFSDITATVDKSYEPAELDTSTHDRSNHDGVGLGVKGIGDNDQIDLGEKVVMKFDQPVNSATVGLAGLGGHFVENSQTNAPDAKATWTALDADGNVVDSGEVRQDSQNLDGDNNLNTYTLDIEGPFETLVFSVDANKNSNYTIEYVDAQYTSTQDSFEYTAIDAHGNESAQATMSFDIDIPESYMTETVVLEESFENLRDGNGWHIEHGENDVVVGDSGVQWTVNDAGIEVQRGNTGNSTASEGESHVEFDTGGSSSLASIGTSLSALAGAAYTLEFDYRPRPGTSPDDNRLKVVIGDEEMLIDPSDPNSNISVGDDWSTLTLTFTAKESGEIPVSFTALPADNERGLKGDSYGAYLDNVKVTQTIDSALLAQAQEAQAENDLTFTVNNQQDYNRPEDERVDFDSEDNFILEENGTLDFSGASDKTITADFESDNSGSLSLDDSWNEVKNARAESEGHADVSMDNFVYTQVDLGDGGDSNVEITDAKRGDISTGDGDDTISIDTRSNGDGWSNTFNINTNEGDDTISINDASPHSDFIIDGGSGLDTLVLGSEGLDFSQMSLSNIEQIDLGATNELTLSLQDVLDITPADNRILTVEGKEGDEITLKDAEVDGKTKTWTDDGTQDGFHVFSNEELGITLQVDDDVSVHIQHS